MSLAEPPFSQVLILKVAITKFTFKKVMNGKPLSKPSLACIVMHMGLSEEAETFMRVMHYVLHKYIGICVVVGVIGHG